MSRMQRVIRWVIALVVAAVLYFVVSKVIPMVEGGVSVISPLVLVLNTALLATAVSISVAGFVVPREHIVSARKILFVLGMLAPIGLAVWDFFHAAGLHRNYLAMLGGAFSGGMIAMFVLILPKPQRQVQKRRFS